MNSENIQMNKCYGKVEQRRVGNEWNEERTRHTSSRQDTYFRILLLLLLLLWCVCLLRQGVESAVWTASASDEDLAQQHLFCTRTVCDPWFHDHRRHLPKTGVLVKSTAGRRIVFLGVVGHFLALGSPTQLKCLCLGYWSTGPAVRVAKPVFVSSSKAMPVSRLTAFHQTHPPSVLRPKVWRLRSPPPLFGTYRHIREISTENSSLVSSLFGFRSLVQTLAGCRGGEPQTCHPRQRDRHPDNHRRPCDAGPWWSRIEISNKDRSSLVLSLTL